MNSSRRWWQILAVAGLLLGIFGSQHVARAGGPVTSSIVAGPDGNLWFTASGPHGIGRITPGGQITWFPLRDGSAQPRYVTVGPDGSLWFSESSAIGRLSADTNQFAEFFLPTRGLTPDQLVLGRDGNIWFVETAYGTGSRPTTLGRITPTGQITEFPVPGSRGALSDIAAGPDGAIWFTTGSGGALYRMMPTGRITTVGMPSGVTPPSRIIFGPDGNLWFSSFSAAGTPVLGHLTPEGTASIYPFAYRGDLALVSGLDGAIWFAAGTSIGRISMQGAIVTFPLPLGTYPPTIRDGQLAGIGNGPDGNVWFTFWSFYGNITLGKIAPSGRIAVYPAEFVISRS